MKRILFCLVFPLVIYGEVKVSTFVKHDTKNHQIQNESNAPYFKGLIIIGNKDDLNPRGYENVHGVMSYHVDLPGGIVALKKSVRPYYNAPLNSETISAIKRRVIEYYRNNGRPIVAVSVVQQDITDGVLQLMVTEGKLGKITCKGNQWFKETRLIDAIQLESGENIASDLLDQNLYWLNRNPFRQIDAIYTPGEEEGTTNIELICKDRFPLRIYAGIDNTGNDVTGNNRLFTGFNWGMFSKPTNVFPINLQPLPISKDTTPTLFIMKSPPLVAASS